MRMLVWGVPRELGKSDRIVSLLTTANPPLDWREGWARLLMRTALQRRPIILQRVLLRLGHQTQTQEGRCSAHSAAQWLGPTLTRQVAHIVHQTREPRYYRPHPYPLRAPICTVIPLPRKSS